MLSKRILVLMFVVAFLTLLTGCFPAAPPIIENQAPSIVSTPVTTATVGVTYIYDVNATDPDGDTLTYSLTTKPSGMNINSANGLIMWAPIAKGNYAVVVKASDGALFDTQGFTIVVSKPLVPSETYTITASAGLGGSISPLGDVTVNKGSDQLFTITPDSGYSIDVILIDECLVIYVIYTDADADFYTFENVIANHTIHATFKAVGRELTKIVVEPEAMDLIVGQPRNITSVTAYYDDESTSPIALNACTYTSITTSNTEVVKVDKEGIIEAVGKGTATVVVSYKEKGITKTDEIIVTVTVPTY